MTLRRWINTPALCVSAFEHLPHPPRHTHAFAQALCMSLLTFCALLFSLKPVFAESVAPAHDTVTAAPVRSPHNTPGLPPLPFTKPLVGPLIKNVSPSDIDHRTTAFIPQSLDNLTPIEFPKTAGKWIRVDLSEQIAVAYEGKKPIRAFVISSGLPGTPTVTGEFHIRMKVLSQTMVGGQGSMYYNLPNVKWVQYFYEDYSFHGTYWHNNFGHPMSHGCINMTNADAKWLFDWASPTWDGKSVWYKTPSNDPGTLVIIHE